MLAITTLGLLVAAASESELDVLRLEVQNLRAALEHVQSEFGTDVEHGGRPGDVQWKLLVAAFVFLMQLGFAMIEAGSCRQVNVISTYAKNILDFTFGALTSVIFGCNIAYGIDALHFARDDPRQARFFNHLVYQATAATIVSGSIAERVSIPAYATISIFVFGILFSLAVRASWAGGFLAQLEVPLHDFAGAGVVHITGGASALACAYVVGPRNGRWDSRKHGDFAPHDVKSVLSGVLILWVAWYGFNPGATVGMTTIQDATQASHSAITTTIAGATSGCFSILISYAHSACIKPSKGIARGAMEIDVLSLSNGILTGLVAVTAGSDVVDITGALIIGVFAAVI